MKTIELPEEVYALAEQLAERCEWTIEQAIHQALIDARDLQDDLDLFESRELRALQKLG